EGTVQSLRQAGRHRPGPAAEPSSSSLQPTNLLSILRQRSGSLPACTKTSDRASSSSRFLLLVVDAGKNALPVAQGSMPALRKKLCFCFWNFDKLLFSRFKVRCPDLTRQNSLVGAIMMSPIVGTVYDRPRS